MKRRILIGVSLFLAVVAGLSLYLAITVGPDLLAARRVMSGSVARLSVRQITTARAHLEQARNGLDGFAAGALELVPIARQNLRSTRTTIDALLPVVDDGLAAREALDAMQGRQVVQRGAVRLELLAELRGPIDEQVAGLDRLKEALEEARSGWLLPPVWDQLEALHGRATELSRSAHIAADGIRVAQSMLGEDGRRTYLVLLINNAELRGAGGILSGIGTISATAGRLYLGDFKYYRELAEPYPYRRVDAPEDFAERFGRYWADATLWVNTSASPDVPDVARVAANLLRLQKGIGVDGAIVMDPQGIAALLPPATRLSVPGAQASTTAGNLPEFVYSRAYELPDQRLRRAALLSLGRAAFEAVLRGDFRRAELEATGRAAEGQHVRVVSFDPHEQAVLDRAGLTGDLRLETSDGILATTQNLGADKLDYWIERDLRHSCTVADDGGARCVTAVSLRNRAPKGLPPFVVGDKKEYAFYTGYLEVYVPGDADITGAALDGGGVEIFREHEEGRTSVGMYVEAGRGTSTRARVFYDLPPAGSYSLAVTPQPLVRPARLTIDISVPDSWTITGPDSAARGNLAETRPLTEELVYVASPPPGAPGIPGLWRFLLRFWQQPLF